MAVSGTFEASDHNENRHPEASVNVWGVLYAGRITNFLRYSGFAGCRFFTM
jgi:hypothetical protein